MRSSKQSPIAGLGRFVQKASLFVISVLVNVSVLGDPLDGDDLFRPNQLLDIKIEIPRDDWNSLCAQSRGFGSAFRNPTTKPFTYFKGDLSIDGVRIESVGIRKKGFIGSLDNYRPSLKIKFDEYVDQEPVDGLDRLTLNNNKQDSSLVSQFLTYKLFRDAGLHAPRCNMARVTVNGEYLGIYSNVESYRKPFLKKAFGTASGNLIEGTLSDFYPKAIDRLEVKNDDSANAIDKFLRLSELLAAEGDLNLSEVREIVDVPYFLKFWAIESLIGFWDGYSNNQNNYFSYENPENGKLYFMPWGADGAFGGGRGRFRGRGNVDFIAVYGQAMLANRLYWAGDIPDRYRTVMQRLLATVWNEEQLTAEIDRIEKLVEPYFHEFQSEVPLSMDDVRRFVRGRRNNVVRELENQPGSFPRTPRKPMYTVDVGRASGSFEAVWRSELGREGEGRADLTLILEGETVRFSKTGARVGPIQYRGFGRGFRGGRGGRSGNERPQVAIVLVGVRQSDSQPITLTMTVNRGDFVPGVGRELAVEGSLSEEDGRGGFGRRGMGRAVSGILKLGAAGVREGDAVSGSIDLSIVETRGGMFGRR